jgi:hypothetical protein
MLQQIIQGSNEEHMIKSVVPLERALNDPGMKYMTDAGNDGEAALSRI